MMNGESQKNVSTFSDNGQRPVDVYASSDGILIITDLLDCYRKMSYICVAYVFTYSNNVSDAIHWHGVSVSVSRLSLNLIPIDVLQYD